MSKWSKNYWANVRDRDTSMLLDRVIAQVCTVCNVTQSGAIEILLREAALAFAENPDYSNDSLDRFIKLQARYQEAQERIALRDLLSVIYEQLGIDGLRDLEDEIGMDVASMVELAESKSRHSKYATYQSWIASALDDGRAHEIQSLVEQAIAQGVLPKKKSPEWNKCYNLFKVAGSKLGVSGGKRGYWQAG